jgi:t-SNARE complex subunit (syntaxin)
MTAPASELDLSPEWRKLETCLADLTQLLEDVVSDNRLPEDDRVDLAAQVVDAIRDTIRSQRRVEDMILKIRVATLGV